VGEQSDNQVDPAIQARVAEILTEIAEGMRWRPLAPSPPASSAGAPPEQHILDALESDDRARWAQLPDPDRKRLIREFRNPPISPTGLSYLRKKITSLAPPAPDQGYAQPAAVSSSADGKAV
jgi:hypothetical protein